jgi:DNA polymerase-3 subunit beta
MDLTVRRIDLLRELQLFQPIVERKNTIPILANLLIETVGDVEVRLVATDLEVGLRSRCTAAVTKEGALTVSAKKLYEVVRALPETIIAIKAGSNGAVNVTAESFDSWMQTLPRDDFPQVAEAHGSGVAISRTGLREMVGKTRFAITGEDTRYFLNGALLELRGERMQLVATDGHRLALVSAARTSPEHANESDATQRAILPKKALLELARLVADGDEDVTFTCGENHLFFDVDGRQLISRVIDGQFPAYEPVVRREEGKRIEFARDRLTNAITRVALLSSERSSAVTFRIDRDSVEIRSSSPEVGGATEILAVDHEGDGVEVAFNAQYLLDFLAVADTESVELAFKDEKSKAIMTPVGVGDHGAGCDFTYVIMPMRV